MKLAVCSHLVVHHRISAEKAHLKRQSARHTNIHNPHGCCGNEIRQNLSKNNGLGKLNAKQRATKRRSRKERKNVSERNKAK